MKRSGAMFGPLIVIYLFLAGAGCGTFVAAVYLSQRARSSAALRRSLGRVALPSLVSCGMVAVAPRASCWTWGGLELALDVLANPAGSVLSVGAWALVAFMAAVAASSQPARARLTAPCWPCRPSAARARSW
ncbi:MAG: hypothetical protein ACLSVD_18245 [Eggerthellaceae bacterium]